MNGLEYAVWTHLNGNRFSGGITDFSQPGNIWINETEMYRSRVVGLF